MSTVHLVNERPGIQDLSMLKDINGKPVVLQPKGLAGASCECPKAVMDSPIIARLKAANWLSVGHPTAATEAPAAAAPPPPPAPAPVAAPVEAAETIKMAETLEVAEKAPEAEPPRKRR